MSEQEYSSVGIIKWFSRLKGFGFIKPDEGDQDIFVHYSAISDSMHQDLREGERVRYDIADDGTGPKAKNVRIIK